MLHQRVDSPYPHCHIRDLLPDDVADSLLRTLEELDCWKLRQENFYTHYSIDLSSIDLSGEWRTICSRSFLYALRTRMSQWFDSEFSEEVCVWAHKLTVGNGIGIHNDNTPNEFRLVLQLNRGWDAAKGGFSLMLQGPSPYVVERVYPPVSNTAIAFETDRRSYHAVTEVMSGERYSIVFVFTKARS